MCGIHQYDHLWIIHDNLSQVCPITAHPQRITNDVYGWINGTITWLYEIVI